MAIAGALAGCGGQPVPAVATPAAPPAPVPIDTTTGKVAAVIQAIADGVGGVLPKIGLDGGKIAQGTALVGELAGIAGTIASGGAGGALAGLLGKAERIVAALQPFIPNGKLAGAVMSALSHALSLAGMGSPFARAAAGMPPEVALRHLRTAAAGRLP
jgi:hypothetical protein